MITTTTTTTANTANDNPFTLQKEHMHTGHVDRPSGRPKNVTVAMTVE